MIGMQLLLVLLTGLCVFICECDNVTFNNVTVEWCNNAGHFSGRNCVNTTILHSHSLAGSIPSGYENFTYITISHQHVPVLYENSVANTNLKSFELSSSGLTDIEPGAFQNLIVYDTLSLRDNNLKILRKGIFKNTTIRYSLKFDTNAIQTIEEGTFEGLKLHTLDLSNNSLEEVPPGLFNNLTVKRLNLDRNKIKIIRKGVFVNSLGSLELAINRIKLIEAGAFENLQGLYSLGLGGNLLETIPKGVYNNFHGMIELILTSNRIKSIEPGAFENSGIAYLHLSDNKLEKIGNGIFGNSNYSYINYLLVTKNNIKEIEPNALDKVYDGVHLESNDLRIIKRGTFKHVVVLVLLNNKNLKTIEPEAFNGTSGSHNSYVTKVPKFYLEKENSLDEESRTYLRNLTESGRFNWLDHVGNEVLFPFG